ncbi:MAG: polyprenyl synthetase family protein [Desulfobacterales bacterium]|nr:polyprenyl synthetase family protein [Desulfobacterales bacterium]
MLNLDLYLDSKRKLINAHLREFLQGASKSKRLVEAMRYSLMAGGKRLRPVLCLVAAEVVGGQNSDMLRAACAIEMIHTYSLIHDDLPVMDNDAMRRGKPTCHIAFDEATALLAGDALLTLAFQILSAVEIKNDSQALKWIRVLHRIAHAAGYQGMIEGQMRDIDAEDRLISLKELRKFHALKTGALIEAAVYAGAVLGGGNTEQLEQLGIYAQNIGLAFQVKDDILNVEGDPKLLGKAVGTDKVRKKNTYPSLMGLKESKSFAKKLVNQALQAIGSFNDRAEPLRAIANYIIQRKR